MLGRLAPGGGVGTRFSPLLRAVCGRRRMNADRHSERAQRGHPTDGIMRHLGLL